jgi:hypothetical protein
MYSFLKIFGVLGDSRNVSSAAVVDHVELSPSHLVVGLDIDWRNETNGPLPVKEIQMRLYLSGRGGEPLRFYPLERFEHVLTQRAIQKTPVRPFTLPPCEIHNEQIRFISQEICDISPGTYAVDFQITDTSNASYNSRLKIQVEKKAIYRRSKEWS